MSRKEMQKVCLNINLEIGKVSLLEWSYGCSTDMHMGLPPNTLSMIESYGTIKSPLRVDSLSFVTRHIVVNPKFGGSFMPNHLQGNFIKTRGVASLSDAQLGD